MYLAVRFSEGGRANKFRVLKTLVEIGALAEKQIDFTQKKAGEVKNGIADNGGGLKRKDGCRAGKDGKKGRHGTKDVDFEIDGPTSSRHAALDALNFPYILWGHSQKVQLAGVLALAQRVQACLPLLSAGRFFIRRRFSASIGHGYLGCANSREKERPAWQHGTAAMAQIRTVERFSKSCLLLV
jgi:hypothetical protein